MSHYYFHIRMGPTFIPDEEGMECKDMLAVHEEAISSEQDLAVMAFKSGVAGPIGSIEIEDEDGNPVIIPHSKRSLH